MREILFRGKRLDNGEWVYGIGPLEECSGEWATMLNSNELFFVDPDTIGQYAGRKDKNGLKIFEGDIVTGVFWFGMEVNYTVVFRDGAFGLLLKWNGIEHFGAFTSLCNVEYTIIGNIHDNHSLLEGDGHE